MTRARTLGHQELEEPQRADEEFIAPYRYSALRADHVACILGLGGGDRYEPSVLPPQQVKAIQVGSVE